MTDFNVPPHTHTQEGRERVVGFELEYAGMDLAESVRFLSRLLGSEPRHTAPMRYELPHALGTFTVEVDASWLQKEDYRETLESLGFSLDRQSQQGLTDFLESLASVVVPYEIVTPPLPLSRLPLMQDIVHGLRERKAKGTTHAWRYAFGLHINAEACSLEADSLRRHLQAFALLYDWISREAEVDLTRRLGPHIRPYPNHYLNTLLRTSYQPDRETLIRDYMTGVGSRNHALDMLPLFASIDETTVLAHAQEPGLIKARPAFHYRLANSRVDDSEWLVASEWNYWVAIERIANDEDRLGRLLTAYEERGQSAFFRRAGPWADVVAQEMQ